VEVGAPRGPLRTSRTVANQVHLQKYVFFTPMKPPTPPNLERLP